MTHRTPDPDRTAGAALGAAPRPGDDARSRASAQRERDAAEADVEDDRSNEVSYQRMATSGMATSRRGGRGDREGSR